jgi:hypothetical protein
MCYKIIFSNKYDLFWKTAHFLQNFLQLLMPYRNKPYRLSVIVRRFAMGLYFQCFQNIDHKKLECSLLSSSFNICKQA